MAFTQNTDGTFVKQPRKGLVQIVNADAQAAKTVVTAGASGSKVVSLIATSNDTSARDVQVALVRSAVTYILGVTTVGIGAGTIAATPAVDLLNTTIFPAGMIAVDNDGQKYLFMESGDTLVVSALATVTAAKTISAHSDFGDF